MSIAQPRFRVLLGLFLPELEMKDGGIVGRIEEDLSDDLTGRNLISRLDINPVQVTIDGEVITMTDNHRIVEAGGW